MQYINVLRIFDLYLQKEKKKVVLLLILKGKRLDAILATSSASFQMTSH